MVSGLSFQDFRVEAFQGECIGIVVYDGTAGPSSGNLHMMQEGC